MTAVALTYLADAKVLAQDIQQQQNEIVAKYRAIEIGEFLEMQLPVRECLLEPWLPAQGLAMIHAYRGTGKTHVALGIAVAVSSGGAFLRWQAESPRGVLILDGEMPAITLQERLAAIIDKTALEPAAPLRIITPDFQEMGMPNLADPEGQLEIDRHLNGVDLIIVDNISTLCRGGRENESESWLPVQEWALRLRSRGISVLFVHHSGKGGGQRGTSRREDVLDTVISLRHSADYSPDSGACFEVHYEKARGCHGDAVKPFEAKLIDGVWSIKDLEDSTTEKVAAMLNDGCERKDIADALGVNKSTVSRAEKKARELGLIRGKQ
ncbi:RNA polymerase subunit sigma-70 [Mariprofundus erugo]|uniref:RNA polymerase subunit sigma-70 n=1 Tax=Mariprofundus erugo TaxID=2528639 RepID=A0A5R9GSQ9_9PROT|nr:AAA family ATPase [Mariprofundus erugo]TLS68638.1 RNA polymerase subunit sigma-70 [Mariprofundus erugo]